MQLAASATRRAPRRHARHGGERHARKVINQRINIDLADKIAAFLRQLQLQHFSFGPDVLGIGRRSR